MDVVFGILYSDPEHRAPADELRRAAAVLGAPGAQLRVDRNFGLGLQRDIVDPRVQASGIAADDNAWTALTGEIENHSELVRELRRDGPEPVDTTDAAILLALYHRHGAAAVSYLHGYFNAVIWDRRHRHLLLFADRCAGVKAMYYCRRPRLLAFGSTIKGVIAHDDVPRELDRESLEDVLTLGYPVAPRTMFRHVSVLTAGRYLVHDGRRDRIRRYWRRNPWDDSGAGPAELEHRYFQALVQAVARCAGEGETNVMLSGGVDSAALVSLLRHMGRTRIRTWSVHIGDPGKSDLAASRAIARRYGTEHHCLDDLDAHCLDMLPEMLWHFEAPAQNIHPTWWLAHRMRRETRVVLAGHGNDLVWGCADPAHIGGDLRPARFRMRYLDIRRRLDRQRLRTLYPAAAATDAGLLRRTGGFRARTGHLLSDWIALDEGLYGDQAICRELGKSLVDAHGIWPRLPYASYAVTRCAESVPPPQRLRALRGGGVEFKSFFKDLMHKENVLPPEVIYRRKTWMYSPTAQWLRSDLRRESRALLLGSRMRERRLFDPETVERLLAEHQAEVADHSIAIMMLVGVEIWQRLFIDPPVLSKPDCTLAETALEQRP